MANLPDIDTDIKAVIQQIKRQDGGETTTERAIIELLIANFRCLSELRPAVKKLLQDVAEIKLKVGA